MKKSNRLQALMPPLMGMLLLLNKLEKPRIEALHGSDVFYLVGSGFLLGIGFDGLLAWLKPGAFASSTKDQSNG